MDTSPTPMDNQALEEAMRALTRSDGAATRFQFLGLLRDAPLAVPTARPVPVDEDGSLPPGLDIPFVAVVSAQGRHGIPAFTRMEALRAALPQAMHGLVLTGAQIAHVLAGSGYMLFVDAPGLHAEVNPQDLLPSSPL